MLHRGTQHLIVYTCTQTKYTKQNNTHDGDQLCLFQCGGKRRYFIDCSCFLLYYARSVRSPTKKIQASVTTHIQYQTLHIVDAWKDAHTFTRKERTSSHPLPLPSYSFRFLFHSYVVMMEENSPQILISLRF